MDKNPAPLIGIPARLESTRLPRKALLKLGGKPLIACVHHRIKEATREAFLKTPIMVFTDSEEISHVIKEEQGEVFLSTQPCSSGTERIAQGVKRLLQRSQASSFLQEWDQEWIINVQGDEPLLPTDSLIQLISSLTVWKKKGVQIVTLGSQPSKMDMENDPNLVKLCVRQDQRALFFSRENIGRGNHLRHIGVYAFHVSLLDLLLEPPTGLAKSEDLEQLSWMERGEEIGVELVQPHPKGIDTLEDFEKVSLLFSKP